MHDFVSVWLLTLALGSERANVLVQAKEVAWVVFRLELLEPVVVWPIGSGHRVARLIVAQIVHIAARCEAGFHRCIYLACPGNAPIGQRPLYPLGQYEEVVAFRPVWKSRVTDGYSSCGPMQVLEN